MKKVLLIILIITITGCSKSDVLKDNSIYLDFIPYETVELKEVEFSESWIFQDNRIANDVSGVFQILVGLYKLDDSDTFLVLQDRNGFYDMDLSFEGEPERVNVFTRDTNHDGNQEMVVVVDKGITYKHVKIYDYDGVNWRCILDTVNLVFCDLDNDRKDEAVTTSFGSNPAYVWIYRWNDGKFEKSDIVKDLDNTYASIILIDEELIIESGNAEKVNYYKYGNGKLYETKQ